ncbi:MAG: hypothetical protein IJT03_08905 [Clostridia bacterium]|nr:hypothetical protein [Clostridia bacterium]
MAAYHIDNDYWEDADNYILLKNGEKSNCRISFAAVKVITDEKTNTLHMLFMLIQGDGFEDASKSGAELDISGCGTIGIFADGSEAEYDDEVYYVDCETVSDGISGAIYFDTDVGIKHGIPGNVRLTVSFRDADGVRSNTFVQDITHVEEETSQSTKASAASKVKKVKTTKTAKSKTSKTSKKTKTTRTVTDAGGTGSQSSRQIMIPGKTVTVGRDNKRKLLAIAAGAAVLAAGVGIGCAEGIKRKKNKSDDKGAEKK